MESFSQSFLQVTITDCQHWGFHHLPREDGKTVLQSEVDPQTLACSTMYRQPIYPYCAGRQKQPHCEKWTHTELLHHRALSLAEENPKLGNFLFLSLIKPILRWCIFLDTCINESNASSEFKMSLWHLKLFVWQLHDDTNWRLWLHCRIIQQDRLLEVSYLDIIMSVNSMAMKEIAVSHTWDLYVPRQRDYPKISWLRQSKSFLWHKKMQIYLSLTQGGFPWIPQGTMPWPYRF